MDCASELHGPVDATDLADAILRRRGPGRTVVVVVPPEDRGAAEGALRFAPLGEGWLVTTDPDVAGLLADATRVRIVPGRCVVLARVREDGAWDWLATDGTPVRPSPIPSPTPTPPPRPVSAGIATGIRAGVPVTAAWTVDLAVELVRFGAVVGPVDHGVRFGAMPRVAGGRDWSLRTGGMVGTRGRWLRGFDLERGLTGSAELELAADGPEWSVFVRTGLGVDAVTHEFSWAGGQKTTFRPGGELTLGIWLHTRRRP